MTISNQSARRAGRMQPPTDRSRIPTTPANGPGKHSDAPAVASEPHLPAVSPNDDDADTVGHLPPSSLLLARPVLLAVCALIGAILGLGLAGSGGYQATAVLEFSPTNTDSLLVKQTGQTLARTATSDGVVAAAEALGSGSGLSDRVVAEWQEDTRLVSVTVTADSQAAAIAEANAVATSVVATLNATRRDRLTTARTESNELLNSETLDSPDAEAARRAQLGNALGLRQDAVSAESSALSVADPATEASVAGLTRTMGLAIGLVAGLLLGGLLSLLLGVRGLRLSSAHMARHLAPGVALSSPSQAAQLAGEFVESGNKCLAVVVGPEAKSQGIALADDITQFVDAHGMTVELVGPFGDNDRAVALKTLRHDVRQDIPGRRGVGALVVVVESGSEASALLEGQSDLMALLVVRKRHTSAVAALRVLKAYERAKPVLVLAR